LPGIKQFADLIAGLQSHEALAFGTLRPDQPEQVTIVTKNRLNGTERPGVIARTSTAITYREKQPALALLDFDTKGMPPEVRARLETLGGFWPALVSVLPCLSSSAHVTRCSTSAGLYRAGTQSHLSPGRTACTPMS
jgi:hypothetical protein